MQINDLPNTNIAAKLTVWLLLLASIIALSACQGAGARLPSQPADKAAQAPVADNQSSQPPSSVGTSAGWAADGIIASGEYQNATSYGSYSLCWSSDKDYIYVGMKAPTTGWIAIGFDPESKMKNADIVEGYVKDGKLTIADMYSKGEFGPHPPDTQLGGTDDILASGGKTDGAGTIIEFKRKLSTGDAFDKPLHSGKNKIIWAYGNDPSLTIIHSAKGTGEIELP